jgi:hypothetical protein
MELIQLLNLCKPIEEQMPATFDSFKNNYLDNHGHFTKKGTIQFLDEISGHISYLNREKDARQFAQPIIKRVLVDSADETTIQKFDKGLLKNETDETLLNLKTESDEKIKELNQTIENLEDNSKEMEKVKILFKKKCNNKTLKESKCKKIVNKNIRELVNEVKSYKQSIKTQLKKIKEEIKSVVLYKENEMKKIIQNIERNPEMYEKYKKSPFFIIKSECGKTVKTNQEVLEELENHPEIIKYNEDIKKQEKYIEQLKESLKIDSDAFKLRMRKLRELLSSDLNDLEKSTVKMVIKENQNKYTISKQNLTKKIQKELEQNNENIQLLKREKKKKYQKVQKSLKQMLLKGRKEEEKKKKNEKKLRKTLKQQEKIEDILDSEIKNNVVKEFYDKQEIILEKELENAEKGEIVKEKMKKQEKEERKKRRETMKKENEEEKRRKKEEKEKNKTLKNRTKKNKQ